MIHVESTQFTLILRLSYSPAHCHAGDDAPRANPQCSCSFYPCSNSRFMKTPVLGAAVATLCGWIAACVTLQLLSFCNHDSKPQDGGPLIGIGTFIAVMSSAVFVPLYLKVPRNNFLWKSAVCIPLGALAGFITLFIIAANGRIVDTSYYFKLWYVKQTWPFAIVGATIWLVATKSYSSFHPNPGRSACSDLKLPSIWRWLFLFSITSQVMLRAIFYTVEDPSSYYHHYDPWNHPIRATVISFLLNSTGLFLLIFTPRFFHRLGFIAILAWIASVITCAEYFALTFIPTFS